MSLKRVLVVNKAFPAVALELLRKEVEPTVLPLLDHEPESLPKIKETLKDGYDGLIWNTRHRLSQELLDLAGPKLKAVSSMTSGLDHIDVSELKKRGIALGHTPKAVDNAVADMTVGLLVAAARRFKEGVMLLESGEWKYGSTQILGQDIAGSTVGIVAFGGVGHAIVRRLKGFDVARFIYSERSDKPEAKALGAERVPQEQLFRESDHIILACPLTNETKNMINAATLKSMKKTAVLINIGRGELVDQEALLDALCEQCIFSAGLDVVTPEPLPKDHPLVFVPNCWPKLKVVSSMSSGLDHIDVSEVQKRGILLGNSPTGLAVADITVGLLVAAARRFKEGVKLLESGEWKYGVTWMIGQDIEGSTVGIVGFGSIGQAIVRRLKGFDVARFIYCGRSDKPEAKALGVERVPQEQLFRESDHIILACPLTNETKHLINADTLKLMKETAVLVNIGRGELVDQEALYDALKEQRIFSAGLDVVTPEPLTKDHPLVFLPNCYIIPHMGNATIKTSHAMASIAATNVLSGLNGKPLLFPAY